MPCKPGVTGLIPGFSRTTLGCAFECFHHKIQTQTIDPKGPVLITVNLEIFTRILFSQMAFKDIFATLKTPDKGMIYVYQSTTVISPFKEDLFSRNFAYAKFRTNETLAKISEFSVLLRKSHKKFFLSSRKQRV